MKKNTKTFTLHFKFSVDQTFACLKSVTVRIKIHIYITVDNSEFHAYQQKQVNGPHLDPLCFKSSVGVLPQNRRQCEYECGEDSPQCLQASSRLNLQLTIGWLFMHAMCNFNCVFSCVEQDQLELMSFSCIFASVP